MTQEEKKLLLQDLSARCPYGVKVVFLNENLTHHSEPKTLIGIECVNNLNYSRLTDEDGNTTIVEFVKPYLFPLSSMTEEQYKEWCDLEGNPLDEILTRNANDEKMSTLEHHLLIAKSLTDSINYCYKNHFDVYGLIPMGLALDATGLNIY